jgi:hypothetical protein
MLKPILNNSLVYFCLAAAICGLAIYIAPEKSYLKISLQSALNQTGKVKIFIPLLASLVISFTLTLLIKIIS